MVKESRVMSSGNSITEWTKLQHRRLLLLKEDATPLIQLRDESQTNDIDDGDSVLHTWQTWQERPVAPPGDLHQPGAVAVRGPGYRQALGCRSESSITVIENEDDVQQQNDSLLHQNVLIQAQLVQDDEPNDDDDKYVLQQTVEEQRAQLVANEHEMKKLRLEVEQLLRASTGTRISIQSVSVDPTEHMSRSAYSHQAQEHALRVLVGDHKKSTMSLGQPVSRNPVMEASHATCCVILSCRTHSDA